MENARKGTKLPVWLVNLIFKDSFLNGPHQEQKKRKSFIIIIFSLAAECLHTSSQSCWWNATFKRDPRPSPIMKNGFPSCAETHYCAKTPLAQRFLPVASPCCYISPVLPANWMCGAVPSVQGSRSVCAISDGQRHPVWRQGRCRGNGIPRTHADAPAAGCHFSSPHALNSRGTGRNACSCVQTMTCDQISVIFSHSA